MEKVYIQKCSSYLKDEIGIKIDEIFERLNISNIVKPDMKVCIKPNFIIKKKVSDNATTNPVIIKEVAKRLVALGAKVIIAESPGGAYNKHILEDLYKYYELKDLENIGVILNTDTSCIKVKSDQGNEFEILKPIAEADIVVNLAKLKTHSMMNMTACIKNLFGIIPGISKAQYHASYYNYDNFAMKVIEICSLCKNQICILDAIDCMEGNGPTGGNTRHLGYILSGINPYSIDNVACRMINFEDISYIDKKCIKQKLVDINSIEIIGENIEDIKVKDFRRPDNSKQSVSWKFAFKMAKIFKAYPKFDMKKCIKCKRCIDNCPKNVLELKNDVIRLDKKNCISCFCCQELCPNKAITIKKGLFYKS